MGRLIRDWLGREDLQQLLAEMRNRFHGTTYTFDDLIAVSSELGTPLDETFGNWLGDVSLPGFQVSEMEIVRLPDLEYGLPQYESTFFIENSEPTAGMFSIEYFVDSATATEEVAYVDLDPVILKGNSALEVALHSQDPLQEVLINPYFSLNRAPFELKINQRREYPEVARDPKPYMEPVDWARNDESAIIVDDLDAGFSLSDTNPEPNHLQALVQTFLGFALPTPSRDQGLPAHSPLAFAEWSRQQTDSGYGRYRRTLARATAAVPINAHFDTSVPESGRWRLEYHLPDARALTVATGIFVAAGANVQVNTGSRRGRQRYSDFVLYVVNNGNSTPIDIDGSDMRSGWNRISEFDLTDGEVRVAVSTQNANGTVAADAIRWTSIN